MKQRGSIVARTLILVFIVGLSSTIQAEARGVWITGGSMSILRAVEDQGFKDATGMWRNFRIEYEVEVSAICTSFIMNPWQDRFPIEEYRVKFLEDTITHGKEWYLGYIGGGQISQGEAWDLPIACPGNDFPFQYWSLHYGPVRYRFWLTLPENQDIEISVFFDQADIWTYSDILGPDGLPYYGWKRFEFLKAISYAPGLEGQQWNDSESYINHLNGFQIDSEVIRITRDGINPPELGHINFQGYYDWNLGPVPNWIPVPGDTIGLQFGFSAGGAAATMFANVNWISTWQGEAMNLPTDAPVPYAVANTDSFFDFKVIDPFDQYEVTARSFDMPAWELFEGMGNGRRWEIGDSASVRSYSVITDEEVNNFILWLRAEDYAAHAVVAVGGGNTFVSSRLQYVDPIWGDTLWSITVPRDYDGYKYMGENIGDFMADAWELQHIPVSWPDSAIVRLLPFDYNWYRETSTPYPIADQERYPEGRKVPGDRITNFEEYRGFRVTGDQRGFYNENHPDTITEPRHERFDPFLRKDVLLQFNNNLHSDILANVAGWTYRIYEGTDTTNALQVHLVSSAADPNGLLINDHLESLWLRARAHRVGSYNQFGAWYPYYSWPGNWTKRPFVPNRVNVVTFWRENDRDRINYPGLRGMELSKFFPPYPVDPSYDTPWDVSRCVIFLSEIQSDSLRPYYQGDITGKWERDYQIAMRQVISHEFAHGIGMVDNDTSYIFNHLTDTLTIMNTVFRNTAEGGRLIFYSPYFDSTYADSSIEQTTIKRGP